MPVDIDQNQLAETFRKIVQKTVEQHCKVIFKKDAKVAKRDIIEYESRMRVFGLEKFNDTCYIGMTNLYESPLEQEKKDTCGALIVYIAEENAEKLFKTLLKGMQGEDEELIMENTQKLCQVIFEQLQKELGSFGYPKILAGEVEGYLSNIESGVDFPYEEDTLYQVSCTLWKEKVFVAELVLAPAQHG